MGTLFVVVLSPLVNPLLGICHAEEPVLVQTLLPEAAIERFDVCILCGLSWAAEVKLHVVEVSPPVQRLRNELRSIVHADRGRLATLLRDRLQNLNHVVAGQTLSNADCQILTGKVIDSRQNPKSLATEELVGHEVHAPILIGPDGCWPSYSHLAASVSTRSLATHLQPFLRVNPINQLVVNLPTLATKQNVQSAIAILHTTGSQVTQPDP